MDSEQLIKLSKTKTNSNNNLLQASLKTLFKDHRDNLSAYLVAKSKKPCAIITLSIETNFNNVIDTLSEFGIYAKTEKGKTGSQFTSLAISNDLDKLNLLIHKLENQDHNSIGLLLGYPETSVTFFSEAIKNKKDRIHYSYLDEIVTQIGNGKSMSVNFAYGLHIPKSISTAGNRVVFDNDSEDLFNKYMSFVRHTNPELSKSMENEMCIRLNELSLEKALKITQRDLIYTSC